MIVAPPLASFNGFTGTFWPLGKVTMPILLSVRPPRSLKVYVVPGIVVNGPSEGLRQRRGGAGGKFQRHAAVESAQQLRYDQRGCDQSDKRDADGAGG